MDKSELQICLTSSLYWEGRDAGFASGLGIRVWVRVGVRVWVRVDLDHGSGHREDVGAGERRLKSHAFEQDATERPQVGREVVGLALVKLRGHVLWGPNGSLRLPMRVMRVRVEIGVTKVKTKSSLGVGAIEDTGDAEVAEFDSIFAVEEDVLWLGVRVRVRVRPSVRVRVSVANKVEQGVVWARK